MGRYNSTCAATYHSISEGEEVVLLPLFQNNKDCIDEGVNVITIEGALDFYVPFCLPIYGKIDAYGRIVKIEKNKNIEILENYFNNSIKKLAAQITDSWRDRKLIVNSDFPRLGCFVSRFAYDRIVKFPIHREEEFEFDKFYLWTPCLQTEHFEKIYGKPSQFCESVGLEAIKLKRFTYRMYWANRFIMPALNGSQCGDYETEKLFNEIGLKLAENKINE